MSVAGTRAEQAERFRRLAWEQLPRLYRIARRIVGDDAREEPKHLESSSRPFGRSVGFGES